MPSHPAARRRSRCAFTLVELLVVIGIIAALIGILLPVLSGVQSRGRDIKCQSNLRQILQALHNYATENKGSMPYGFYWDPSAPRTWDPVGSDFRFVSWASQVGRYMAKGTNGDNVGDANFPPVLKCPEAELAYAHVVSYVMNMIVGVSPWDELVVGNPPTAQMKPPLITLMLKDTALVWDTAIQPDWQDNVGFLLGADIDGQRFWDGAKSPQLRYYSVKDPFGRIGPGIFGQNRTVQIDVGGWRWYNIDPKADTHYPFQGNLRFRHGKGTACNVGFADGSVRQFHAKLNGDQSMKQHDALRRNFMIKWPQGVPPDPSLPN
jgi:prepilin-type processing-associated H-X9-DG protein/prepilin-type N-terminal cleavage/methylation domain-containing protein